MKIVHFPEATHAANGIHYYADPQGFTVVAIEITKEDLKRLAKNGKLYVIAGPGFVVPPPMQITLDNPFTPLPASQKQNPLMIVTTSNNEKSNTKSSGDDGKSNDGNS